MRINLLLALLIAQILGGFGISQAQNTWIQKPLFPGGARLGAVGFSNAAKGYIGTGYMNPEDSVLQDLWEWNPASNSWRQRADFIGAGRGWAVGGWNGAKGYIGLGQAKTSTEYDDFFEYDTTADSWTQIAVFGGVPISAVTSFTIGSKLYAVGYLGDMWEYDPASTMWAQKSYYPGAGYYGMSSFSIGDKGYVGLGSATSTPWSKDFWEYDPAFDTWTQRADFGGVERGFAVGFAIGPRGYIGTGGSSPTVQYRDFWEYNPTNDTWTRKADFGGLARYLATGFSIGKKGYIGTGWTIVGTKDDFWEYTQDTAALAVEDPIVRTVITISPNPFTNKTSISANRPLSNATLTIHNSMGQEVRAMKNISGQTINIQRDNLPSGIYFVRLIQGNTVPLSGKPLLIKD